MSNALTGTAPADEPAAPSVEDTAPAVGSEVDDGSAGASDVKYVEASRFNGLMGRFNQEKARADRLQAELEALRSQQQSHDKENTEDVSSDELTSLRQQVQQLTEMLTMSQLESARERVLSKYPEARPFADLIIADNPQGLEEMAREISERVKNAGFVPAKPTEEATDDSGAPAEGDQGESTPTAPVGSTTPPATEAPVTGGGATFDAAATLQDRVADAIKAGNFQAYLAAKRELAEAQLAVE